MRVKPTAKMRQLFLLFSGIVDSVENNWIDGYIIGACVDINNNLRDDAFADDISLAYYVAALATLYFKNDCGTDVEIEFASGLEHAYHNVVKEMLVGGIHEE